MIISDRLASAFDLAGAAVADLIYPPTCAWCRIDLPPRTVPAVCSDCRGRLAPTVTALCWHCSAPLSNPATDSQRCFHCACDAHPCHRAVALGRYRDELSQAILRTKHSRNELLTIALAELLFELRQETLAELNSDSVIPMPMHWLRRCAEESTGPNCSPKR